MIEAQGVELKITGRLRKRKPPFLSTVYYSSSVIRKMRATTSGSLICMNADVSVSQ
jgi:hypothetical protein